jgi:hypothetical protein
MFSSLGSGQGGFIESKKSQIEINNISYPIFNHIMHYLYSGKLELGAHVSHCLKMHANELEKHNDKSLSESANSMQVDKQENSYLNQAIDYLIDLLRAADEYLLEEVKNYCQFHLIKLIDDNTFQIIAETGELYSAERIVEYCQWYQRRKVEQYGL